MAAATKREELVNALKGQELATPDLEGMIGHWPRAVNSNLDKLRQITKSRTEREFSGRRLHGMNAVDAALLSSSWWPYAPFEELCIATHFATWLFAWDDETDSKEYTNLIEDLSKAASFRDGTIEYVQECFSHEQTVQIPTPAPTVKAFGPIGEAISKRYTREQADTFLYELLRYLRSTKVEQEYQIHDHLPTVKNYIYLRISSSAVTACLALTELCHIINVPRKLITDDPEMQKIWSAANLVVFLMNDILSLKKEIAQGQVDSILPLLYLEHRSLDAAMTAATELITKAVEQLDDAELSIMQRDGMNGTQKSDIEKMIKGCKYACTGNLNWSLSSDRYKIGATSMHNGFSVRL